MKRKMLETAGILSLSFALGMGMVGCAGTGDGEPDRSDIQDAILQDGDGTGSNRGPDSPDGRSAESNHGDGAGDGSEIKDGGEDGVFYDGANLSGRVVDFSDTGCTITPETMIINEDGSMEGGVAAPGCESEETNIHITYAEDVVFQVVYFSMEAQAEISREDTDKSSIKKETDVDIFGACQDEKHWVADKVVITRWQ